MGRVLGDQAPSHPFALNLPIQLILQGVLLRIDMLVLRYRHGGTGAVWEAAGRRAGLVGRS